MSVSAEQKKEDLKPGQMKGLRFLVELQEHHHLNVSSVPVVANTISNMFRGVEDLFKAKLPDQILLNKEEILSLFHDAMDTNKPFGNEVVTNHKIKEQLRIHCNMVPPTAVPLDILYEEDKNVNDLIETRATAQVVSFKESLTQLLNIKEVFDYVMSPFERDEIYINSVRDGRYLTHVNEIARKYKNPLLIGLYEDDCEFVNPLGSYCKIHKVMMAYFVLYNIPQHLLSSLKSISLVSICKAQYIKDYGFEACFADFLDTINELESEKGLELIIRGESMVFHGTLVCVLGDSLALNALGGFKEGIGGAYKPCRSCYVSKPELKEKFYDDKTLHRNKALHLEQLELLLAPHISSTEFDAMSKDFGITKDSVLNRVKYFDITKCLVHDIMHNLPEGVSEIATQAILIQMIIKEKKLTFDNLNHLIQTFPYPKELKKDIPSNIEKNHVVDGKLRQSASQMMCLIIVLPLILAAFVKGVEHPYLANFSLLATISHNLLAYKVKRSSIDFLKHLIFLHHTRFKYLYPDISITPKFHFLVHAPDVIRDFGPCRANWTMRFEARHCRSKLIAKYSNNFKNIEKTLAIRFQMMRASELGMGDPDAIVLGDKEFCFENTSLVKKSDIPFGPVLSDILKCGGSHLTAAEVVYVTNFKLEQGTLLICEDDDDDLPLFGKVVALFVHGSCCALVVNLFVTDSFDYLRNAYVLHKSENYCVYDAKHLPSLQSLPFITYGGIMYAVLTYYDRNEVVG